MIKKLNFILPVVIFSVLFGLLNNFHNSISNQSISHLQEKHDEFLKLKAPKREKVQTRLEKIKQGLPPNAYYEQLEYLTMNPALGYPEPYKVKEIREQLQKARIRRQNLKAPGRDSQNSWASRGPNNVGGRTRALFFDPNDPMARRVFAGAVSGGLWVNNDVTQEYTPWKMVKGLSSNLNISSITVDPRDQNTWYVGTGEQYTGGDVIGTGVYKTTDAGENWEQVLSVKDFATGGSGTNALIVGGLWYINDIQAWDNGTSTEIFIGVSTHIYANARNPTDFLGYYDKGLYSSKDGGDSWQKIKEEDSFNDFEIDAEGDLWVVTTYSPGVENSRGGKVFERKKGENTEFSLVTTIPGVSRTEIEASASNPNKFYVLAEEAATDEAALWITTDSFASISPLNEPIDADLDIDANDFTRGQAFYDLVIESDPTDDAIVYVGGIDLFRSNNSGQSWEQISKWSENENLDQLPVSYVHADQHVITFRPGNTNQAVFGHDGGVSFAKDLAAASSSDQFIPLDRNYTTTQFYSIAVAPLSFAPGDYFLGGTQDNGTQLIENGDPEALGVLGGDGAHSFYDQVATDYFIANLVYNDLIVIYDYSENDYTLIAYNDDPEKSEGFFINPQGLDSNLDKLYSNGPEKTLYRYDNLPDLKPLGDTEITSTSPEAPRKSLTNSLLNTSISSITISPYTTSTSTVLVGLINGRLLKIENADGNPSQATWSNIGSFQFLGSVSDVEFGSSENEIYVTFYNFGVKNIWYTKNGKDPKPTWVSKEGNLPDLPVLSILANPTNSNEVIVGTELGVWATQNFQSDSPSWEHSYNGMSDVKVTDLDLKKGTNKVFAASYGRGMFSGNFKAGPDGGGGENPVVGNKILVYPSVSDGTFNLISGKNAAKTEVLIYDLSGQLVQAFIIDLIENIPEDVNLFKEASGIYLVKIKNSGTDKVQKIVKK